MAPPPILYDWRPQLLRERYLGISNAGTPASIVTDLVNPGAFWLVTLISMSNDSGEATAGELELVAGPYRFQLIPLQNIATGDAAIWNGFLFLGEGDQISAEFTGAANKGQISLSVSGLAFDLGTVRPGIPQEQVVGAGAA